MKIKVVDMQEIKPYFNNPRHNDDTINGLRKSIAKFGFRNPIIVDEENIIVSGHARYKALLNLKGKLNDRIKELNDKKESAAIKVLIKNLEIINKGKVFITTAEGLTKKEIKEFRLTDNKLSEFASWDYKTLKIELGDLGEDIIGFSDEEIDDILKERTPNYEFTDEDGLNKKKSELDNKFKELVESKAEDMVEMICPSCGEEYNLSKDEILKSKWI